MQRSYYLKIKINVNKKYKDIESHVRFRSCLEIIFHKIKIIIELIHKLKSIYAVKFTKALSSSKTKVHRLILTQHFTLLFSSLTCFIIK